MAASAYYASHSLTSNIIVMEQHNQERKTITYFSEDYDEPLIEGITTNKEVRLAIMQYAKSRGLEGKLPDEDWREWRDEVVAHLKKVSSSIIVTRCNKRLLMWRCWRHSILLTLAYTPSASY